MSASRSPTRWPSWARATARLAATVDLPTPPLPLATATTCRTSGIRLASWEMAFCAASSRPGGLTTWMLTFTSSTPGRARSVRSTSSRTFSPAAGLWVAICRSTATVPPIACTWCTKPKETMSRLMPGNFTPFRASHTLDSKSFDMSKNPSSEICPRKSYHNGPVYSPPSSASAGSSSPASAATWRRTSSISSRLRRRPYSAVWMGAP